jgi:hypothetical protein
VLLIGTTQHPPAIAAGKSRQGQPCRHPLIQERLTMKCYASGALQAFLVARLIGGASEEQMAALKTAAAAESAAYQPSRARPSSSASNVVGRERLDRARRERAEARRAYSPTWGGPAA